MAKKFDKLLGKKRSEFKKLLDKATDSVLVEADWEMIMNAVDCVRSGEVPPKAALASVRKRYQVANPHVVHHSLLVLEALVKNCGDKFHREVATKETMEDMKHLAAESSEKVKEKILELIQCWAHAFRDKPEYKIVKDTHTLMKLEGFQFPAFREADAMFAAEMAPDWVDSDACYRCKTAFSLLNRKHHCRNCGQIFCDKCSGRYIPLPHIGIEKEVRVCETCFDKVMKSIMKPEAASDTKVEDKLPIGKESKDDLRAATVKPEKDEAAREDEELQLALAISQSEAEEKERQRQRQLIHMYNGPPAGGAVPPESNNTQNGLGYKGVMDGGSSGGGGGGGHDPSDNELARYLNRDYWEQRRVEQKTGILRQSPTPSAPSSDVSPSLGAGDESENALGKHHGSDGNGLENGNGGENGELKNGNPNDANFASFAQNLRSTVDVFVSRIRSDQMRGRSVIGDGTVQTMFMTLTNMHSQLLKHLNELDDRRGFFESLQDKLAQIQDAREAIEALRDEHEQHRRAELMELQRQRQVQMFAKLGVMRQKKHEMLEQQRMVALQRMEEERRQMEIRKQMQLQQAAAMMGRYQGSMMPGQQQQQPGGHPMGPQQHQQAYYPGQQPQSIYYGPGGVPMPNPYDMGQMAANLPTPTGHPQQQQAPQFSSYGPQYPGYGHPQESQQQQQQQFHQQGPGAPIASTYPPPSSNQQQQPPPTSVQAGGNYYQQQQQPQQYAGQHQQQQGQAPMAPAHSHAPSATAYYPGSPSHGQHAPPAQASGYPGSAAPQGYPQQGIPQQQHMPQYVMAPTAGGYDQQQQYQQQQQQQPVYHQQQHGGQPGQQQHSISEAQLINFD